ncbi:PfaD family polyunsaturated fatty acid/polyketide biosynthesis protein [Streptomyces sp. NPDC002564]|uniref:PfaD family polyunsaturated fatty acid/polyketide biosynthesis protein n=1 Tax=Streptomyces sp. NPDC002564 TaxID=3364649 RepID=UPI00368E71A6
MPLPRTAVQNRGCRVPHSPAAVTAAVHSFRSPARLVLDASSGSTGVLLAEQETGGLQVIGSLPALYPEWLGDRSFTAAHGTRFAYVAGEMANGISSVPLVTAMSRAGFMAFFGAAGLASDRVSKAVQQLRTGLGGSRNWGVNLIHNPMEPGAEEAIADLLIRSEVPCVSTSAFMDLTPSVVRCAVAGLRLDGAGRIVRGRRIFAKVSRPETARLFMSPPPGDLLEGLLRSAQLTEDEVRLAARIPVATDVTAEADSGGHTDNRPLVSLLPVLSQLRNTLVAEHGFEEPVRIGAAGGLGTPQSLAAAFAMGAAYVVVGSVNQGCVESALSARGKSMLAGADLADVTMAPAADMFELGINVQVLRRGSLFPGRARQLYTLYETYGGVDELPRDVRERLEQHVLGASLAEVWHQTRAFWNERDPREVRRAEQEPKHRMALMFRWYLGNASRWAIEGTTERATDFQIWCGPAMGAFNRWTAGSFLADPAERTVVQVALNLMEGAAVVTRAHQLGACGLAVPTAAYSCSPRRLSLPV